MEFLDRMRSRAQERRRGSYLGEHIRKGICFMSQHDMNAANASGATVRGDYNNALVALATLSSGVTAPATTFAYQPWADTTSGLLKQRNAANTGWEVRETLAETLAVARSSNTIIAAGDFSKSFICTGTFTQTLTAAATLGDGFMFWIRNDGTGVITIDPNAAETIDGAATIALAPGDSCVVFCDGSLFYTFGRVSSVKRPVVTVYTAGSGTHTTTVGATRMRVRLVGGGAGGAGAGTSVVNGTAGNNTTFSTLTGSGGAAAQTGGAAAGGDINIPGGSGAGGGVNATGAIYMAGGSGGVSAFGGSGGGGNGNLGGLNAATNSGSGGGGGGAGSGQNAAHGGGAGGYVEKLFTAPAASYSYAVGGTAAGGSGSTTSGGTGAAGIIIVEEFFD